MGKLGNLDTRKFIAFLEKQGCALKRKKGSHWHFKKEGLQNKRTITVTTNVKVLPFYVVKNCLELLADGDPEKLKQLLAELEAF